MSEALSIVIAARNEARHIEACIASARAESTGEILVVDGASEDETPALAERAGAKVLRAAPGLARQLNAGGERAEAATLLFLSADTRLVPGWRGAIEAALSRPSVVAGGFRLRFDRRPIGLRAVEIGGNLRSRYLRAALPDQGLFARREAWERAGRFPADSTIPHLSLCRSLRALGEVAVLRHPIVASAREYETQGVWRTVGRHAVQYFRYRWREAA